MWRAYIAQHKYRVVLDGISTSDSVPIGLKAIRKIAEYMANASSMEKRNSIVKYFEDNLESITDADDDVIDSNDNDYSKVMWFISASTVFTNEMQYESAFRAIHYALKLSSNLECYALQLQCLLRVNRLDLAKNVLNKMQEKDDDATLTQLATAWVSIEQGGEKLKDAYFIFQDFCDKFILTSLLLNGQAVCYIGQEEYEEADAVLRMSLDKDPNNLDTLINCIVLTEHYNTSGKPNDDVIKRYLSQIRDAHPYCQLISDIDRKENDFDRLCSKYAPTV